MRVKPNSTPQLRAEFSKSFSAKLHAPLLLMVAGLLAFSPDLYAAEAIVSYTGHSTVGYAYGGAGFAFTPTADIAVTSLGYGGSMVTSNACTVAIWNTNGQALASALVTSNSAAVNRARYEPIPALMLEAGETYYLQSLAPSHGLWLGDAVLDATVSLGPSISYLGAAFGTNADGIFPNNSGPPTVLPVGPNFLYQTPPFVLVTGLTLTPTMVNLNIGNSSSSSPTLSLLEADQPFGPWRTNSTAVVTTNVPDKSFTIKAVPSGGARFYSVQSSYP